MHLTHLIIEEKDASDLMSAGLMTISGRMLRLIASRCRRSVSARLNASIFLRWRYRAAIPERLLIAPQDLRTADPIVALDIYSGRFSFAGQAVETHGQSPFDIAPPSDQWVETLHGFGWLRHLRASDKHLTKANARILIEDWIRQHGVWDAKSWDAKVTARRTLSWLSQSPIILEQTNLAFYRTFTRSLMRQVMYLQYARTQIRPGYGRLLIAIALAAAGLCIEGQKGLLKRASKMLEKELNQQILADGGHVSRNPALLIDILADLLPLRQCYAARAEDIPPALITAIDRIMPMLRFFQNREGTFAHFNGAGATPSDLVATILAYDDTRGQPVLNASHSGYQRIESDNATLLVDTGPAPKPALSQHAHAGTLAFEFSAHGDQIIVNCGTPIRAQEDWLAAARATPAHSTLIMNDANASRFIRNRRLARWLDFPVIASAQVHDIDRQTDDTATRLIARHDGYRHRFGVIHERRLSLNTSGTVLEGEDRLVAPHDGKIKRRRNDHFAIRFHLHPRVAASVLDQDDRIALILPNGHTWHLHAPDHVIEIEESIYLLGAQGIQRTEQAVIHSRLSSCESIAWTLQQVNPKA